MDLALYFGGKYLAYSFFLLVIGLCWKVPHPARGFIGGAIRMILGVLIITGVSCIPDLTPGMATVALWILRALAWAATIYAIFGRTGLGASRLAVGTILGLLLNLAFDILFLGVGGPMFNPGLGRWDLGIRGC